MREVLVAYKIMNEEAEDWRHATVWRPVRQCIKLFEIGDTSFIEDMKNIRRCAEEIITKKTLGEEGSALGSNSQSDLT